MVEVSPENNYTFTEMIKIGTGSFGTVYQSTIVETGEKVAIKKVFQDKKYKNREHQIMKMLENPTLVKLKHSFFTEENNGEQYLNVVMEFIPDTLSRIIRQYQRNKEQIPMILVKTYAYQMYRGISYLESLGICHRDIKPQNILIDPNTHVLKICDFGSAKQLVKGEPNIAYICSRYYRAPELILGAVEYDSAIDVWSVGCVIAEMILGVPLFPGNSAIDQLVEIIKILGTPSKEEILKMNPKSKNTSIANIKPKPWGKVFQFKNVSDEFLDLISKILVYDPNLRPKSLNILQHPFFDELRIKGQVLPNKTPLPDLFNFSQNEINQDPEIFKYLIPSWYK